MVIEPLVLDVDFAPVAVAGWTGTHVWLGDTFFVGARVGAKMVSKAGSRHELRDLGGGWFFEFQSEVGIPIVKKKTKVRIFHGLYSSGTSQVGYLASHPGFYYLDIVTGHRMTLGLPEERVAIPIGVRFGKKSTSQGDGVHVYLLEAMIQARALIFVPSGKVGFDFEAAFGGIGCYLQIVPSLLGIQRGDPPPLGPVENTIFNPYPAEVSVAVGMRFRGFNFALPQP